MQYYFDRVCSYAVFNWCQLKQVTGHFYIDTMIL